MILDDLANEFSIEQSVNCSQFFSYYPKYEYLDKVLSDCQKTKINLFVDVKGCAPALYMDWGVKTIIEYSRTRPHLSIHVFCAILQFIAFHKMYAAKRGIDITFYFFMEEGRSKYHLNVYKDYKCNRDISDFFGLDLETREYFNKVMDSNYSICEYVINRIPKCYFYKLKYCEADFMPWYLMEHVIDKNVLDDSVNIIYSRDKDMHQCLSFPNSYQYYRGMAFDKSAFINEDNCFEHWFKVPCKKINRAADWFPLFLAMVGDDSDSIPGIKGVGPKTISKFLDTIYSVYGENPDTMYDMVMSGTPVIYGNYIKQSITADKIFKNEKILQRNMKLISYRALSDYVLGKDSDLASIDIKKYIDKISTSFPKIGYKVLVESMNKKGFLDTIDEKSIETCFI